jgi:hypothetical protein
VIPTLRGARVGTLALGASVAVKRASEGLGTWRRRAAPSAFAADRAADQRAARPVRAEIVNCRLVSHDPVRCLLYPVHTPASRTVRPSLARRAIHTDSLEDTLFNSEYDYAELEPIRLLRWGDFVKYV